ncbi:MAG: topoisomerase IV [Clostridiales bacterium]|jgi:DNA gyrase subunit A|nr:topoisomerase IV [Clostridiales bacterium]
MGSVKKYFTEQPITETLEQNYMPYAMSVIISRAIPEIDGFKPAHRKLLFTMYKMGLLSGTRTKSANVVGQTMRVNPHGDMAIYETMVRLTQGNDALLHPLVDSKGNFGKVYSRDMAFAASRYTEVKLADICNEMFADLDKNTVEFIDNYDGTMKEPTLLPTKFPNILVNPNQGIAVGMASNICSFNLKEVCAAAIAYLKNPKCDLTKTLIAPDFTTGGELIYNEEMTRQVYDTGRGSFKVRAVWKHDAKNHCIDITQIPYTTTNEAIIDKIVDLIKQGRVKEISDVRDETDLKGLKITIDLKRGANVPQLMAKLFKYTPLQDNFSCNFNVLIGVTPKVMGVGEILSEWSAFRINCLKRQLEFDIKKKSARLHLLQGLEKILLDIDKAVTIIRNTELEVDVVPNLMKGFGIDDKQAEFIAEIKLRNINKEYILKRINDIESLIDEISSMRATLADEGKIKDVIITQLKEISKKYGRERLTKVVTEDSVEEVEIVEQIEDYALTLFATRDGYLKKISMISLRGGNEHKLKEGDEIIWTKEITNKSEILVFTNKCNVYKVKTHTISDCKASTLGEYLPALLGFETDEAIVGIEATVDFNGHFLFAFENGKMAKIPLKSYETKLNRKKLGSAYFGGKSLVNMIYLEDDSDLVAMTKNKKVLVFNTSEINEKATRSSQGVSVMTVKKGDVLDRVCAITAVDFADMNYYRTKHIPAVGCFIKTSDEQMGMF